MYSWITCNVSKKWLAVCVLAMAPSSFLAAQTSATGVIAGTVTDSTNAVVQHAALTLAAAGSNASRVTRSGEDGRYASIGKRTSITERVRLAFSFDMINASIGWSSPIRRPAFYPGVVWRDHRAVGRPAADSDWLEDGVLTCEPR